MKYDLSSLQGNVSSAALKFTIASDPGSGTISVYKGNGTNWTEENLSTSNRPSRGTLLGSTNKTYSTGSTHTISLNASDLGSSFLSLVVVHSNGNDTDFASKEHATYNPPQLIINGGGGATDNTDNTGGSNNNANGITLSPEDDAYLQGSTRYNTTNVRVDGSSRITYLKYDLSSVQDSLSSAELKFTIATDPGSGTISVYKGNGTNWTEINLSISNRPSQGSLLGSINKTYTVGSKHTITLNKDNLGSSLLSLIVVHSNGNDTDFASKEHSTYDPPQLILNGGGEDSQDDSLSSKGPPCSDGFGTTILCDLDFEFINNNTGGVESIWAMQDQALFIEWALNKAWALRQYPILRDEINDQLGTNYGSYNEAQNAFTYNYVKNIKQVGNTARDIGNSFGSKAWGQQKKQESYTKELISLMEWEEKGFKCFFQSALIIDGFPQPASPECQKLFNTKIRGRTLKSLGAGSLDEPSSTFINLKNEVLEDFAVIERLADSNWSRQRAMNDLAKDEILVNTFAHEHNLHINNRDHFQKVLLMAEYLHYTGTGRFNQPPPLSLYTDNNPFENIETPERIESMGIVRATNTPEDRVFREEGNIDNLSSCNGNGSSIWPSNQSNGINCTNASQAAFDLRERITQEHIDNYEPEDDDESDCPIPDFECKPGEILNANCECVIDLNDPCANKDLINKEVSPAVLAELNSREQLTENPPIVVVPSFRLETIDDGWGGVINQDKYTLNIKNIPDGFTPFELFDEIRKNFGDIVVGGNIPFVTEVNFEPYSPEDGVTWNSDNPVGAAMDFSTFLDTSTVYTVEYNAEEMYWIFATVTSFDHAGHFVAGLRQFGLERNAEGGYSFYLRGADRLGGLPDYLFNGIGSIYEEDFLFNTAADDTWKNFMQTLKDYILDKPGGDVSNLKHI